MTNPRTGKPFTATVILARSYVNVVAFTEEGRILMVEQYRFGRQRVTLECPAGLLDAGEQPADCARRELREETGYTGGELIYNGAVEPNPAFMTNECHHFLVRGCRKTHDLEQDPGEDLVVREYTPAEVVELVCSGRINNALTLSALSRVMDLRNQP